MNVVERSGMSEQAQGETKWSLGELAFVRGHASALNLQRLRENSARPARKTSIFVMQKDIFRHALAISFSSHEDNFFVMITASGDGKEA